MASKGSSYRKRFEVRFNSRGGAKIVADFKGVGAAAVDSRSDMEKFRDSLLSADAALSIASKGLEVATATFQALKAPVDLAVGFEQQFAQIKTLNAAFGADLERDLLALASSVPQTASDVANSAYRAISAGIPEQEVIGFLQSASEAATAGNASLTDATAALTKTMAGFSTQGVDSTRVMDVLFATVKRGDTDFTALSQSIGMVAGRAGASGTSID
jgi:hypothetical protein